MRAIGGCDNPSWRRGAALGCALLLLVPLVCAAGAATAAPGHQPDPFAAAASHHGAATHRHRSHQPHWAAAGHPDGHHHEHGCCAVVVRKPGREDTPRLSAPAASSPLVTPAGITQAAPVRGGQVPDAASGPPCSTASGIPLRL
jgi:hypothetical protein